MRYHSTEYPLTFFGRETTYIYVVLLLFGNRRTLHVDATHIKLIPRIFI